MLFHTLTALAAPNCEPLDAATFRAAVVDAQRAISQDDVEVASAEIQRVEANIACLDHAPEPRLWADLLVAIAVVSFADGGDWEAPLAAALRVRPTADRLVGIAHPIHEWSPPESKPLQELVSRNQIWIDGVQVQAIPPSKGWYLVQKTDGKDWNTTWMRGGPISPTWLMVRVERPPRLGWEFEVALDAGAFLALQRRRRAPGDRTRSVYDLAPPTPQDGGPRGAEGYAVCRQVGCGAVIGPEFTARVTIFSRFGVAAHGNLLWGMRPGVRYIRAGGMYAGRSVVLGMGVTFFDLPLSRFEVSFLHQNGNYNPRAENAIEQRATLNFNAELREFMHLEAHYRPPAGVVQLRVVYGFRWVNAMMMEVGFRSQLEELKVFRARPFIDVFGRGGFARFEQRAAPDQKLWSYRFETGLKFGVRLGGVP